MSVGVSVVLFHSWMSLSKSVFVQWSEPAESCHRYKLCGASRCTQQLSERTVQPEGCQ